MNFSSREYAGKDKVPSTPHVGNGVLAWSPWPYVRTIKSHIEDYEILEDYAWQVPYTVGFTTKRRFDSHKEPNMLSSRLRKLEVLDLSSNSLDNSILPILGTIPTLRRIFLGHNNLSGTLYGNGGFGNLKELDISYNAVDVVATTKEPNLLFSRLSKLEVLDLSGNSLNNSILPILGTILSLKALSLQFNDLSGTFHVNGGFSNLKELDISYNAVDVVATAKGIKNLSHLENLRLDGVDLKDVGAIVRALGALSSLKILSLQDNTVEGTITTQASSFIAPLLSHIHLNRNKLNGTLTHVLSNSSNLVTLDLSENEFSGSIPYWLGNLSQLSILSLRGLDFSCNQFNGEIPQEIAILQDMLMLNLSHNKLNGHIPMSLWNLTKIESIDLSYNNLIGSIPEELTQLNSLEVFNVSYNDLSGAIPNKNQFGAFDESSYYGNHLLCGLPLSDDCSKTINVNCSATKSCMKAKEDGFLDGKTFYISFGVSYTIVLLVIPVVLFINPQWRQGWFHYVELVITTCRSLFITCYYFVRDGFRKLSSGQTI
ncbi:probable LRR receptor-like serine/threonine-protein kinase At4g36180 [Eucalyptus grandis]|uniref:probable LRR receptor-like serine/threonine-protein kinase At4g36180 n=1 Tax=Eucalyptus grandis TaxID=71139 RepID=UPI00192ED822|nr:probable LRR receptor-like serine/threonine-protein kinase At4g36180 [Eucalyptus grandis]